MKALFTFLLVLLLSYGYGQSLIWTGYTTSNSNIIADDIKAVMSRSNGNLWVGHSSGINVLIDGVWSSYNSFNVSLPNDNINALAEEANGNMWIGTDEGLVLFDGVSWITYNSSNTPLIQNRIVSIEVSSNGDVWAVSEGGGVLRYTNGVFSLFSSSNAGFSGNGFTDIDTAPDGKVWAVGQNGIYIFENGIWSALNASNPLFSSGITCVEFDSNGIAWLGTQANGLIRYENPSYTLYQSGLSFLSSNSISDINVSSDNTVWIGTSLGISYFTNNQTGSYTTSNSGLGNNDVLSVITSLNGKLWIGTSLGLYTFCSSFIPVISSSNSQMCGTNQTSVLSVTSYPGYSYQWRSGNNPIVGATSNIYTANTAGTYSMVTTNSNGCVATSVSEIVTSNSAVSFISHPVDLIGCPGTSATISCLAKGCGLTYRWQEETSPNIWVNLATTGATYSNVTTAVLTINNVTNAMNGKRYRCRIQGTYAPTLAFSNYMTLTVNTTPVLTLSSLPTAVCTPATVNATLINVADANSSIGTISYLDVNNNVISNPNAIDESGIYYVRKTTTCGTIDQEQFQVVINTSPILSSLDPTPVCNPEFINLVTHPIEDSNSTQGAYTYWSDVTCTNSFNRPDSITTGAFVYVVKTTLENCVDTMEIYASVGTKILNQPKNANACLQGDAVFYVNARGIDLTYQWQEFNPSSTTWFNLNNSVHYNGVHTNTLTVAILGDQSYHQRKYKCKITTSCANPVVSTIPKMITLLPDAQITAHPSNVMVCSGTEVSFTAAATGIDLKYRWQRRTPITPWTNLTNGTNFSNVSNDTLTINNAKASFSGHEFRMIAFSDCASDTTNVVQLIVNASVLNQSLNANACTSDTAYFSVEATGLGITYQWQQQMGTGTFTNLGNSAMFSGVNTPVLQIAQPLESMDGYNYRCKIFQSCGFPIYSVPKKLNVWSNAGPITILNSPVNSAVCSGLTTTLSCFATAPMTIHYQWQYFDVPQNKWLNISNNEIYTGAKTNTLSIVANNSLDNLAYRCAVLANCPPLAVTGSAVLNVNDCGLRSLNSQEDGIYLSEAFPNPADAVINVVVKESDDVVRIELNDLSGRHVYSSIYSQENGQLHSIDCSNYASGMYILKVYCGAHIEQHNIAIQHR